MSNDNNRDFIDLRPGHERDPFDEPPRKRRFGPIIGLAVLILVAIAGFHAVRSFTAGDGGPITDSHVSNQSFAAADIREIIVDLKTARINVNTHRGDDIRINFEEPAMGNFIRPRWEINGGVLNIYMQRQQVMNIFGINRGGTVNIELPENMQGLDMLNISATTGTIDIRGNVRADEIYVNATTGRVSIADIHTDSLYARTSTGNISLESARILGVANLRASTGRINAESIDAYEGFEVRVTTGNINLDNINSRVLAAQATTGRINADNLSINGDASLAASTGNITLNNANIEGRLDTRTSTGNVTFTNVDAQSYTTNSSTGRIRIN